jgi:cytochrome P450
MDGILLAEIARRRAEPALDQRDDILSLLLQARDEDGEPHDRSRAARQLFMLLLAGHETTATGLAWTFDELFRHRTAVDRLRCGDAGYLDAVVKVMSSLAGISSDAGGGTRTPDTRIMIPLL